MDTSTKIIEPLFEKATAFGKTSIELLKLKAAGKTAEVVASLFSGSLFTVIISFFACMLNIAIALWLGELLGRSYYGFLIVAGFYALAGIILLLIHPTIKVRVQNAVIRQLFN
jgi:hypothetical protein